MNVEEFIASNLVQIATGIKTANEQMEGTGCRVGYEARGAARDKLPNGIFQDNHGNMHSVVDFDMAVTTSSTTDGGARLNVKIFEAGAGGNASSESVSRVRFSLPMALP